MRDVQFCDSVFRASGMVLNTAASVAKPFRSPHQHEELPYTTSTLEHRIGNTHIPSSTLEQIIIIPIQQRIIIPIQYSLMQFIYLHLSPLHFLLMVSLGVSNASGPA